MIAPQDVLDFWFAGDDTRFRETWFLKDPDFDAACGQFAEALRAARAGRLDEWAATAPGLLALILLLDQFSRNLHRKSPEAFAADPRARALTRQAIAAGLDRQLPPMQRMFVYLPLQHSEDLADQDDAVHLFEALRLTLGDETVEYAYRHRDLIRRFGRFPHRNAVLGRDDTPEEAACLAQPGAGF